MLRTEPSGDDAAANQLCEQCGLPSNEGKGEPRFFIEIGTFAELGIVTGFFITGNALEAADRVLIKNVVVADPQFERETGANRNETMKVVMVAEGPRKAAKNNHR